MDATSSMVRLGAADWGRVRAPCSARDSDQRCCSGVLSCFWRESVVRNCISCAAIQLARSPVAVVISYKSCHRTLRDGGNVAPPSRAQVVKTAFLPSGSQLAQNVIARVVSYNGRKDHLTRNHPAQPVKCTSSISTAQPPTEKRLARSNPCRDDENPTKDWNAVFGAGVVHGF